MDESGVHTLVVSHLHPDHVGMASRLVAGLGCQFVMHEIAAERVDGYNDTPGYVLRLIRIGQRHGVPLSILDTVSEQIGDRPSYMPPTGLASVGFKRSEEPISDDGSRMGDA